MTTSIRLTLLLCSLPCATLWAATGDAPDGYSHAIGLDLSGNNALVQVRLPPAMYLHAHSSRLDDLRVFDGAGKALPFALLPAAAPARVNTLALPAAIFPVHTDGAPTTGDNVEIRTSSGGSIMAITTRTPGAAKQEVLSALVLDFGPDAARQPIDALVFSLPPTLANYEAQLTLEVSNDLRSWETLAYASLSWLSNSAQQTLTSNRMEFGARAFRYGRLAWRAGKPLQFAAISAQAPVTQPVTPDLDSVTLQPLVGRFAHDLVYQAGPAVPAERIGLHFGPGNVVMPAMLGRYMQLAPPRGQTGVRWEFVPHLRATFYQFTQDGAQRRSGDIDAAGLRAAQWVVRPEAPPPSQPTLTLSWRPATLVFMTSGSAPYRLHVGRAGAQSTQRAIGEVAPGLAESELAALERATPGPVQALAAPAITTADADADAASLHRKLALWSVLLLGVAVLGAMAWKLMRQMKEPG